MPETHQAATERQTAVLEMHKAGLSPTEIGRELGITSQGVHGHLRRLRKRGLLPSKPNARREEYSVKNAYAEVQASIKRQRQELAALVRRLEGEIAGHQQAIAGLHDEINHAQTAIDRLDAVEIANEPVR